MSNCENHKKEVAGITDMKLLAEMIGDLHYETLAQLFIELDIKLKRDSRKDADNRRFQISNHLWCAAQAIRIAYYRINKAYLISKPFMESNKTIKT